MRIFSARVDVTLYLAPFLDKKGFTGALSKRMDGVILAACVRRSSRAALRDAFLELWGSDAPMIGCFGIEAPFDPTPHGETKISGESWAPERVVPAAPAAPPNVAPAAPSQEAVRSVAAPQSDSGDVAPQALVARLSDEVRRGHVPRTTSAGSRGLFLAALVLFLAGAGAFATYQVMRRTASRPPAPAETLPAGTEPVMPADVGTSAAGVPALGGPAGSSPGDAAPVTSVTPAPDASSPGASTPAPPPPVPALEKKNFEVHVASFTTDSMAKNLVKRLRDKGLDAWYAKATNQANWYRIFIGHYATHEEAVRQARTLLDRGLVEHAIAYPDHAR
jgi:cell division septation protein DedD